MEEGTPIPEASAAEAAVVRNAHQPHNQHHRGIGDELMYETSIDSSQQQARLVASHSHQHPPLHHQNQHHRHSHQMHHGGRHYEGHGHGAVKTHITIGGGGGGSSTMSSTAYSSSQSRQQQQTNHYYHGSTDSEIQATSASPSHRTSSLSAAAGSVANTGARSKHNRNRPTTQLHTHLVIGGDSNTAGGECQGRQNANNHHDHLTGIHIGNMQQRQHQAGVTAHSSPDTYPHRLVIGGYTGHVSAAMPLPHDIMDAGRNVGVGRQDFLPQHVTNAAVAIPAPPASGQSELALDEYDYDLLGDGAPDHPFARHAVTGSNMLGDAGLSYADISTNVADVAERMEVEDIIPLPPLIVIDGANVAYAYGKAKSVGNNAVISSYSTDQSGHSSGGNISTYSRQGSSFGRSFQADAKGILIACNYFMNAGCRVQVVLPAQWLQTKSQRRNDNGGGSYHSADESPALVSEMTPQLEVLHGLREQGLLCAAPANDDDDSYAILLARREDARAARRRGGGQAGQSKSGNGKPKSIIEEGGGFVLSNDQFRDAQGRDRTSSAPTGLGEWLEGKKKGISRLQDRINNIPGRISYSFGDVGSINQYGDKELDLIPNPRHPLVEEIEQGNRARELSLA